MSEKRINWKDISRYRNEMYGLAIISIMIFHYFESVNNSEFMGNLIKTAAKIYNGTVGSVGVDIFIFLSGFSICYSLRKKQSNFSFYKKRFFRVIIPYMVLGGAFWGLREFILPHNSLFAFLYDYSLISFWAEGVRAFWYISLISCLYVISPFIYSYGKKGVVAASIVAFVISMGVYVASPMSFFNIEVAILRIPLYFIGMFCGMLSLENKHISWKWIIVLALSVPVKVILGLRDFSFARLSNTPYAIFLVMCYVIFRNMVRKDYRPFKFLSKVGNYSLELYIVHVAIRALMGSAGLEMAKPEIYGACILISIPVSVGYAKLHNTILKRSNKV